MDILIKASQLFLSLTILVLIHELGHFLTARLFKIRVEKFYIFFNPYFSLFKFRYGQTEYGLGWLPLGGYVKIAGMIDESLDTDQMKQPAREDEFRSKPAWQRFLVMVAGVVMNVLLAVFIYICICYTWGDTYFSNRDATWGYNFNRTAQEMGFRNGDRIVSIDGQQVDDLQEFLNDLLITRSGRQVVVERAGAEVTLDLTLDELIAMRQQKSYTDLITLRSVFLIDSITPRAQASGLQRGDRVIGLNGERIEDFAPLQAALRDHAGQRVDLSVLRGADTLHLSAQLDEQGTVGVVVNAQPYSLRTQHYTLRESIPAGFRKTGRMISDYWQQLKMIVQPKTKLYEEVGGFVAIGSIFPSHWNWEMFWYRTALLSIVLAIMNLLPIPGLDGGHALFTLWEMITGRKPSDKFLIGAQYVGLMIILALLIYANGNDIYRFFIK